MFVGSPSNKPVRDDPMRFLNFFFRSRGEKLSKQKNALEAGFSNSGYQTFRDPKTGKSEYVHRRVAEKKLGGKIWLGHEVHHLDGDKHNNRPENLTVLPRDEHRKLHHLQREWDKGHAHCIRCGTTISFNPGKPLCRRCYQSWARFGNSDYPEKCCHGCGSSHRVTIARPLCRSCYDIEGLI